MITDLSQCDEAMVNKLKGLEIEGKPVEVVYINPEKEFLTQTYPTIAVYRLGAYPDNYRWTNDKFYDSPNYTEAGLLDTVQEREAPLPYTVYYGVRLYYEYQQDGAILNTYLARIMKRGTFVEIGGDTYDVLFVSYRNPESTYKEFGEQKENEDREFVEQYLYKLEIDLDLGSRTTKKVSQELIITTDTY